MSYTLKIGDKVIGKVDSIRTPELNEVAKTTEYFSHTSWFDAIGYPALVKLTGLMEVLRQEYIFSLLNPEE
jgi:hypothetical protein